MGPEVASCEGHSASIRRGHSWTCRRWCWTGTAARRSPCSSPTRCGRRRGRGRSGSGTACRRPGRSRSISAVSRTVTAAAYDQLLAEGWVAGRHGAGTFVVAVPAAPRRTRGRATVPTPRRDRARDAAASRRGAPGPARGPGPPGRPAGRDAVRRGTGPGRVAAGLARRRRRAARRRARRGRPAGVPERGRRAPAAAPRPGRRSRRRAGDGRHHGGGRRAGPHPAARGAGGRGGAGLPAGRRGAARCRARPCSRCRSTATGWSSTPCRRASRPSTARRRTSSRSARGCRRRGGSRWWRGRGPRGSWSSRTTTTASCATTSRRCRCSPRWARTSSCTWAPRASC